MVVLCAIVNETMTEGCRVNHEQYTLAVEQKLLHHYLITHPDPRVANNTFATGGEGDDHKGYVIYMTFKYVPVAGTGASATTGGGGAGGAGAPPPPVPAPLPLVLVLVLVLLLLLVVLVAPPLPAPLVLVSQQPEVLDKDATRSRSSKKK